MLLEPPPQFTGHFNGDGCTDIIVGGPEENVTGLEEGVVHIFLGRGTNCTQQGAYGEYYSKMMLEMIRSKYNGGVINECVYFSLTSPIHLNWKSLTCLEVTSIRLNRPIT